jgi:hypothetical protein
MPAALLAALGELHPCRLSAALAIDLDLAALLLDLGVGLAREPAAVALE